MNGIFSHNDYDYKTSLRKTEKNLSSAKYQLESKMRKPIYKPFSSPNERFNNTNTDYSSSNVRRSYVGNHSIVSPSLPFQTTSSDPILSSLLKRVEEQSKTISILNETVKAQTEDIFNLKEHMSTLQNRTINNKANVITERKFEMFQREMRNEIEQVMLRVRQNSSSRVDDPMMIRNHISFDLDTQKRMIEDETDAIRKELDTLKGRIEKLENDSSVCTRNVQDCNRRCVLVERDVSTLTDEERRRKKNQEWKENDIIYIKKELQDISNLVNELRFSKKSTKQMKSHGEVSKKVSKDGKQKDEQKESSERSLSPFTLLEETIHEDLSSLLLSDIKTLSDNEIDRKDGFKANILPLNGNFDDGSLFGDEVYELDELENSDDSLSIFDDGVAINLPFENDCSYKKEFDEHDIRVQLSQSNDSNCSFYLSDAINITGEDDDGEFSLSELNGDDSQCLTGFDDFNDQI